MDVGLLLLRATVGLTLAAHGTQKMFGWFGGYGLEATGGFFEMLGFTPGKRHAFMASFVEIVGGVLLTLGLLTPLAAAIVGSVMIVAAMAVHVKKGFFATNGGFEYNLVLGVAGAIFAFTGPGAISLDALLGLGLSGNTWGVGAFALGIIGAALQLAQRRTAPAPQPAAAA
jgi:putative oxidoreductase